MLGHSAIRHALYVTASIVCCLSIAPCEARASIDERTSDSSSQVSVKSCVSRGGIAQDQVESISFSDSAPNFKDCISWDASFSGYKGTVYGYAIDSDQDDLFELVYAGEGAFPLVNQNCNGMFSDFSALESLDLRGLDFSVATTALRMFENCKSLKCLDVSTLDVSSLGDYEGMFSGCESLESIDLSSFNTCSAYNMESLFYKCSSLVSVKFGGGWDTGSVTSMRSMFEGCKNLSNLDLSNFDTSSLDDSSYMFAGCYRLKSVIVGGRFSWVSSRGHLPTPDSSFISGADGYWYGNDGYVYRPDEIPSCRRMKYFADKHEATDAEPVIKNENGISLPTEIPRDKVRSITFVQHQNVPTDAADWDASIIGNRSVIGWATASSDQGLVDITYGSAGRKPRAPRDSYYLFSDFFSLSDIDLVNLDTSDIKYMFDMFSRCASLESLNLSSLDISGVESLSGIFNGCTSLRSVDLSNLDTSKVIDMSNMFDGCSSLTSVDLSPLETSCVNTIAFMFRGCTSLTSLDLSVFESSELKKMEDAFAGCASLQTLDVSDLDTSRVVDTDGSYLALGSSYEGGLFSGCSSLVEIVGIDKWDTSCMEDAGHMFRGCTSLEHVDLSGWNLKRMDSLIGLFSGCSSLEEISFSGWDTSHVRDMTSMFKNCSSLKTLDLSSFSTENVYGMNAMFEGCSALNSIDISNFDTSSVTAMKNMFKSCSALTELDLTGFDTSRVGTMHSMFEGCSSLCTLDVSSFDTSSAEDMARMFYELSDLREFRVGDAFTRTPAYCGLSNPLDEAVQIGFSKNGKWKSGKSGAILDVWDIPTGQDSYEAVFLPSEEKPIVANLGGISLPKGIAKEEVESIGFSDKIEYSNNAATWDASNGRNVVLGCAQDTNSNGLYEVTYSALEEFPIAPSACGGLFEGFSNLVDIDLTGLDTSAIVDMRWLFRGCTSLEAVDLSPVITTRVKDMGCLFDGCSSLREVNLSSFDTRWVRNADNMFDSCIKLEKVVLGNNFSWVSSSGFLPAQSSDDIPGADGYWYDLNSGARYAPNEIPDCKAATYVAVNPNESGTGPTPDPDPGDKPESTPGFEDVFVDTPHREHINWLASSGISQGFPDGTFRPYTEVVRCDMAAFLYRLAGSPAFEPAAEDWKSFRDVTIETPHAKEILWLASEGISKGYPDGTFRPYSTVTRCDMAAFLHRMADEIPANGSVSFKDVNASTPHAADVAWLAESGVSNGFPDGTFRPYATVVRCDMAAFLHRMEGKVEL